MHIDALPTHPLTGLRALGIGKRGPIWPQLGAAETDPPAEGDPDPIEKDAPPLESESDPAPAFQAITSQEQFDRALARRLAQQKAQYSKFDDYKAKAEEFDKLADAQKTTEQRLNDQLSAVQKENAELKYAQLRADVAVAKGLSPKLARRLTGTTREELEADADDLLEEFPKPEQKVALSQKPKENLRGGGRAGDEEPEETDPRKLAARIPR